MRPADGRRYRECPPLAMLGERPVSRVDRQGARAVSGGARMKPYTVVIEIELPRSRVVELFDDASEKFKWQPGLYSLEHVSGEPGRPRAVSKLVYTSGLQRIELTETVTGRDLPRSFESCYRWGGWSSTPSASLRRAGREPDTMGVHLHPRGHRPCGQGDGLLLPDSVSAAERHLPEGLQGLLRGGARRARRRMNRRLFLAWRLSAVHGSEISDAMAAGGGCGGRRL